MPPQQDVDITFTADLLSELESHNAYFDSVVNMIPARLYVAGASGDDAYHHKYHKGQHKESKEARRARNKIAKREKFLPEKMETTLEVKRRVRKEMEQQSDDEDGDSDGGDIVMSDGDGEDEKDGGAGSKGVTQPDTKGSSSKSNNDESVSYSSRIEMLRAKLHAKMAEKRAAAGGTTNNNVDTSSPALVSKRAARRAEKRKRQEAAKQRSKKKATSVAEQKNGHQQRVINLGGSKFNDPSVSAKSTSSPTAAATAVQDLATIDYQSLAGLKPKLETGFSDNKALGGGKKKKKSLEHLLADAERKQARLRELKASAMEEDRERAKNMEWGETLKVAG